MISTSQFSFSDSVQHRARKIARNLPSSNTVIIRLRRLRTMNVFPSTVAIDRAAAGTPMLHM
jgi:hypothetical protein